MTFQSSAEAGAALVNAAKSGDEDKLERISAWIPRPSSVLETRTRIRQLCRPSPPSTKR